MASLFFLLFTNIAVGQTSENTLKAVYMEKFSRFVTWPDDNHEHFIITMYGDTPLQESIQQIYAIRDIKGRKVIIKNADVLADIQQTHILFITSDKAQELPTLINYLNGKPILTISDSEGFAQKGVIINFFVDHNKLRFEINEEALLKSPLQMSFYLLSSAKIIHSTEN